MATTPSPATTSEVWNKILNGNVQKDDPLWTEYLDKAAAFDVRMVDEWNKIIDVLLVYVALFISVLTSFIIQTFTSFQRNPADITNDLLVAIYNQLAAQSSNITIPPVDPISYFNQPKADYDAAVIQNAVLYTSLSLSLIVSAIALLAKLWLVGYSRQAFSVGSPYERAMKRQEAYNGVLVWNLGGVINKLPVILLIALFLFEFYVFTSVIAVNLYIGLAIGSLINTGVIFLGLTSLGGVIIPGCPFRLSGSLGSFSGVMRFLFQKIQTLSKRIPCGYLSTEKLRWLWIITFTLLLIGADATILATKSGTWSILLFFPASIFIAYSAHQEVDHIPQKYKISRLAVWVFLSASVSMTFSIMMYLFFPIPVFGIGMSCIICACGIINTSNSMADTGEIDAIAWLLITAPPQHPATFFKKAGQMTGSDSIGRDYRPRLLESLMPLLTLLITSYNHAPPERHSSSDTHSPSSSKPRRNFKIELKREQFDDVLDGRYGLPASLSLPDDDDNMVGPIVEDAQLKNLEIYTACLARLSEFTDYEGSFWCLREDARHHPKLEQPLIDKLVMFADPRYHHHFGSGLKSAAIKVLNNYELDMEGKALKKSSSDTVLWSVVTVLRNATTVLMLNVNDDGQEEQGHCLKNLHRPVELPSTRDELLAREVEEVEPFEPEDCQWRL